MFNTSKYLSRRVRISKRGSVLRVRIERQNSRDYYCWVVCFSTIALALFYNMLYGATLLHPGEALYILPLFVLGLTGYILALAIAIWGAFGVEEIVMEAGVLRWTCTALKWTRTREIPSVDITEIKAITPWYGLDNTVELTANGRCLTIGDKLLHDEAIQLAHELRQAIARIGYSSPQSDFAR